jgi:adenylate cyclase
VRVSLIVSEATRAAVPEFEYRELDRVRVKGKDHPVAIFEPLGPADEIDPETRHTLERYHTALENYRACDWDTAERELFCLARGHPDDPVYAMYLDRIMHFRQQPPPADWDGVFTHATK